MGTVGKAISITLKTDIPGKLELLEKLSDDGRLLPSIHREESLAKKNIIMANLNVSMKTILSNMSVDEWLFGGDLQKKIKLAKNLEKTTKILKPPQKSSQQSITQRNTKNVQARRVSSYIRVEWQHPAGNEKHPPAAIADRMRERRYIAGSRPKIGIGGGIRSSNKRR